MNKQCKTCENNSTNTCNYCQFQGIRKNHFKDTITKERKINFPAIIIMLGLLLSLGVTIFGAFGVGVSYVLKNQKMFTNRETFELQTAVQLPKGQTVYNNNQEFKAVPKDLLDALGVVLVYDEDKDEYYAIIVDVEE